MTTKKSFMSRATAFFSAVCFALTLVLLFPAGTLRVSAEDETLIDAKAIGMVISGTATLNGAPITEGMEVTNGDKLALSVKWSLPDDLNHQYVKGHFFYDLNPLLKGITLTDAVIPVEDNSALYIVENNVLHIKLLTGSSSRSGTCGLDGTINVAREDLTDSTHVDLQFITALPTVVVTNYLPGVSVSKSSGTLSYDSSSGEYLQEYTVRVTSNNSPSENVIVSDIGGDALDFSKITGFTIKKGDGSTVDYEEVSVGNGFGIKLAEVGTDWNNDVVITYKVPVDVQGKINGTADGKNTVTVSADDQTDKTATANPNIYAPQVVKTGAFNSDDNTITWTIDVYPNTLGSVDPDFTVTDIPGLNIDADELKEKLGEDLAITKNEMTFDGSKYTYTYTLTVPEEFTSQSVSDTNFINGVKLNVDGLTTEYTSNSIVTVKATFTDFVSKTYGEVEEVDGKKLLPWTITVQIPNSDISSLKFSDYSYAVDTTDTDITKTIPFDGTITLSCEGLTRTITLSSPQWFEYIVPDTDTEFYNAIKGKTVTLSYKVAVPDNLKSLKNNMTVYMDFTDESIPDGSDSDEAIYYGSTYITKKYVTTTNQFNTSDCKFPVAWGVSVQSAGTIQVGDVITVTDTLPDGLKFVENAIKVSGQNDTGYTDENLSGVVSVSYSADMKTATFTITVNQALIDDINKWTANNPIRIVFLTEADEEAIYEIYKNGSKTFTNSADININGTSLDPVTVDTTITAPTETPDIVKKEYIGHKPTVDDPTAYSDYTITINKDALKLTDDGVLTAKDTMGSNLTLVGEPVISPSDGASYTYENGVLNFTLKDETAYTITYRTKIKTINLTANPELTNQITDMFGNTIEVNVGGVSDYASTNIIADAYYNSTGTYEHDENTAKITISGEKSWDDEKNPDARPDKIVIELTSTTISPTNVTTTDVLTYTIDMPADNSAWTYTTEPLVTLDEDGNKTTYAVTEVVADGYSVTYDATNTGLYNETINNTKPIEINITNEFTADTTEVGSLTVNKVWANDVEGNRPAIKFILTDESGNYTYEKELTGNSVTFDNLPLYTYSRDASNNLVRTPRKYTLTEAVVNAADQSKLDAYTLTNSYGDNPFTLTDTVQAGYVLSTPAEVTLTNTRADDPTTSISVTKVWSDSNNQDGKRPTEVTVNLLANNVSVGSEVLNEFNGWTATFDDMPLTDGTSAITYTVTEDDIGIAGYTSNVTGNVTDGFTVTNNYTPEKTTVSVHKLWDDNNDQDSIRPSSVTVELFADNVTTGKTAELQSPLWGHAFTALDKYKDNGTPIVYTIKETLPANSGYTAAVTGDAENGFTVTNTHTPVTIDIPVTKVWNDNNDQDGKRPTSVTVNLLAGGNVVDTTTLTSPWTHTFTGLDKFNNGVEIVYTVEEVLPTGSPYTPAVTGDATGFTITNTYSPESLNIKVTKKWDDGNNHDGIRPTSVEVKLSDGQTATLNESNNWEYTFMNLPRYADSTEIVYTVEEVLPTGSPYTSAVTGDATNGFTVTNSYTPEVIEIEVTKEWDDNNNQDNLRPASVTIKLSDGKSLVLDSSNNWTGKFENLPKYENGTEITYTITEDAVTGYTPTITGDAATGFTVKNTHVPEVVDISGTKSWNDDNNVNGKRPASITVNLLANGTPVASNTINDSTDWSYTFSNMPKYDSGQEIIYTITENAIADYTPAYSGYNIINTYSPGKTSVTVSKNWVDDNDHDGLRPASVNVNLLANGVVTDTVTLNSTGNWTHTFTGLDKNDSDGKAITYSVKEATVPTGYTAVVTGDAETGFTITNTHIKETVSVSGTKTWVHGTNAVLPTQITVNLLADGVKIDSATVTSADSWSYSFDNLDKYNNGNVIVYSITEDAVTDYTATINGYNITNTYNEPAPATVNVSGTKIWVDNNNAAGKRPASITVKLLANGVVTDSVTVTAADNWKYTFSNLPESDANGAIIYSIMENPVSDYTTAYSGYNIINTCTATPLTPAPPAPVYPLQPNIPLYPPIFPVNPPEDVSSEAGMIAESDMI